MKGDKKLSVYPIMDGLRLETYRDDSLNRKGVNDNNYRY